MSWSVDIDLKSAPMKLDALTADPDESVSVKIASAILAVVAVNLAIVASQTEGNTMYSSGVMYISGGVLLLALALCTLSRRFVSLLADFTLLGVVLFDFVGDLFVDVDSLIALYRQDEWLHQMIRACWALAGFMYAWIQSFDSKRRPLSAASKVALCMAIEVLGDGSVIYASVGDISVPLRLNVERTFLPFVLGFGFGVGGGLSGPATVATGPCNPPPPTPPCGPPGDEVEEAVVKVDLADDSMGEASGEENDEPTGSPEPSPQPSPLTSKGPESSPDTVVSDFWGRRFDDPSQAVWGGANRVKLERRVKKADGDEAVVRAAAQIEELSAETASAPGDKAASPRLGKVPKVGRRRDELRQSIPALPGVTARAPYPPLGKADERHLHHIMKTTRTRRASPLGMQVHHADGSGARELDWLSRAVALGCGMDSQSKEKDTPAPPPAPARVATAQIEVEDIQEISTSSMLPEKLFRLLE